MGTNQERLDAVAYADRKECHLHLARYFFAADKLGELRGAYDIKLIVDAACGTGYGTEILARNHPDKKVVGLDNDKPTIAYCKKFHLVLEVQYVKADIAEAPEADAIVSMETVEHLPNWEEVFVSLQRKSKILIFSVPWKQLATPVTKQFHRAFGLYDESFSDLILDGYIAEWYCQRRFDYAILPIDQIPEEHRAFLIGVVRRELEDEQKA